MKYIMVLLLMGFCSHLSYGQVFVEDVNINELDVHYVTLVGINTSVFGQKLKVYMDYGQEVKFLQADKIKDKNKKVMKFNTMNHALNFMYKNGWSYVNYTETVVAKKYRYIYLLERSKSKN